MKFSQSLNESSPLEKFPVNQNLPKVASRWLLKAHHIADASLECASQSANALNIASTQPARNFTSPKRCP
jgi:hypothetical protein